MTARTTDSSPRVLFLSHDAYRAGATIFLLNMLTWLARETDLRFTTLLRKEGEMRPTFESLGPVAVLERPSSGKSGRWLTRGRTSASPLQALINRGDHDLLYCNTITHGALFESLDLRGLPVITHVHELPSSIRSFAGGKAELLIHHSDAVIAVSDAVANHLRTAFACPEAKLNRIYGFVPTDRKPSAGTDTLRQRLLLPLGLPEDAWVIGCCGMADLRKGTDLLVALARQMPSSVSGRQVHFVWVGARGTEYPPATADDDIRLAGLSGRVHFIGATKHPLDWISIFDLHLLLAREDPFPLVVLESATQAVPTVCFEGAGGAPEFTRDDAGAAVPYMDLAAMSATLSELLHDSPRRRQLGIAAQARVRSDHDASVVLPQVYELICRYARS